MDTVAPPRFYSPNIFLAFASIRSTIRLIVSDLHFASEQHARGALFVCLEGSHVWVGVIRQAFLLGLVSMSCLDLAQSQDCFCLTGVVAQELLMYGSRPYGGRPRSRCPREDGTGQSHVFRRCVLVELVVVNRCLARSLSLSLSLSAVEVSHRMVCRGTSAGSLGVRRLVVFRGSFFISGGLRWMDAVGNKLKLGVMNREMAVEGRWGASRSDVASPLRVYIRHRFGK